MLYDDGRDAYVCDCGFAEPNGPAESELEKVAANIVAKITAPEPVDPVLTCSTELSISVNFNGSVSQPALLKKLNAELTAAVRSAVSITSREMHVKATGVTLRPIEIDAKTKGDSEIEV
jgi:hypothetical protein